MRKYRLLERPLPPGLTTLRDYAERIGYSYRYIQRSWAPRCGFPAPVGTLPARSGRGGPREMIYEEKALDAFRALHADLWGRGPMRRVVTSRDLDERITPGEFAQQLAGVAPEVIARYQDLEGFPETGADGAARLGDLVAYWNTRPVLPMRRYHLLERPPPPGLTTLRDYAERIGYSYHYIMRFWGRRRGFPAPVGTLPARSGRGRGEIVYEEKALEAFRALHADLWGRRRMRRVVTSRDLDERITPGEFAQQPAGVAPEVIARYQDLEGFPETTADGTARLGDLVAYWNCRPIVLPAGYSGNELVTIGEAARILDLEISQYRGDAGFPAVVSRADTGRRRAGKPRRAPRKYCLGSIVQFLNTGRPGKRGPAARAAA